jgi:hypothetical protein
MTESEWLACTDPREMLEALRPSGRATERKLRLFACACCRHIWHLLPDERSRRAVEVAEQYADGRANRDDLRDALQASQEAYGGMPHSRLKTAAGAAILTARSATGGNAAGYAATATAYEGDGVVISRRGPEAAVQASMLRDIFGPVLFRPLPPISPAVLAWNGGTVARLAAAVYEERDFSQGRLGVLADAAEEAGVTDADLLAHLRGPGPHVRGCWAVDLILGKQ